MPTHYEVLGVHPSADSASIRAAYIALIKRHHPDALRRHGRQPDAVSHDINLAFSVLKDPEKRALYDAGLRPAEPRPASPLSPVYGSPFPQPARRSPGLLSRLAAASLLAAAMGTLWLIARDRPEAQTGLTFAEAVQGEKLPRMSSSDLPPVRGEDVTDAVADLRWIAAVGDPADAVGYSRHCFAELASAPGLRLLDRCLAFDLAADRWLGASERGFETSYFSFAERGERHIRALRPLSFGREARAARLAALDRLVLAELGRPPEGGQ
jgi:curved DNA-binding protein CbpA